MPNLGGSGQAIKRRASMDGEISRWLAEPFLGSRATLGLYPVAQEFDEALFDLVNPVSLP